MAKIKMGILGAFTGKIGPVIGSVWKGKPYFKSVTKNTKKRTPTPAQQAHYRKFNFLTRWLRPLHPYLLVGFKHLAEHTTEINAAFSYNFREALFINGEKVHIDHSRVCVSRGDLQGVHQPVLTLLNENTLQVGWQYLDEQVGAEYNDQMMVVAYCDASAIVDGFVGGIKRSARSCTFTFDRRLVGKPFHVYLCMMSLNGRKISDSQYLGKIN